MPDQQTTAIDTSVIVAAVLPWHRDHEAAFEALNQALAQSEVVLPSRTLIESYSVLTRLPSPHRLSPKDAVTVLRGTFLDQSDIVSLPDDEHWAFLRHLSEEGVAGGGAYDAEIVATALNAGASEILTLNQRDFERLAPPELRIRMP